MDRDSTSSSCSRTGTRAARRCRSVESLGIDRKTIRKYLAPAIAEASEPGGEPLTDEQWAGADRGDGFLSWSIRRRGRSTWPLIEPHRDRIKDWLDADVTVATIAQRLRDDHEVAVSESSVRRWIATHFAEEWSGSG